MADVTKIFNFEIDKYGARVTVMRSPLMARCLSVSEIEAYVQMLKEDLDVVALKMKEAVRACRRL